MKRFLYLIVSIIFLVLPVFSIEADDSVDSIIKKTYNAEGSSLPKLPKTAPSSVESLNFLDKNTTENVEIKTNLNQIAPETKIPSANINAPSIPQKINVRKAKIGYGKKINVKFNSSVSDRTAKGVKVVFISQSPVISKDITLPTGTVFYGTVVNSHSPQILGNGGLLSIKIDYVKYNGRTSYCEGNIIAVNHQKVLFNNIKGNNGYFKGIAKVTKPARTFYSKSLKTTKKLADGPGIILTPFTYLPGALFLAGDSFVSPFIAMFHKGDRVYISKGTTALIKLTTPIYIEY
ncbi:MAG: hypothetical protein ACI37T_02615 [Candidatus Gastranaerophilaceae bacterium]